MRMRPHPTLAFLTSAWVIRSLPRGAKPRVLLSFDDGPTSKITEGVLQRLEAANARAIFFIIGQKADKNPQLLNTISGAGHALGNHSQSHPSGRWPAPGPYQKDMEQCSEVIARAQGKAPTFFRAPEGRLHAGSILGSRSLGMKHILWSLDSLDWQCTQPEEARLAAQNVLEQVQDGDIILLHEYDEIIWDLLDVLLPGLQEKGFDLSTGLDAL